MEYTLARGHEIMRLRPEELINLQAMEKRLGRGYEPFEIQEQFKLAPLKTYWQIPEGQEPQGIHAQRVRQEFYKESLFPMFKDVSPLDVEKVHIFDNALLNNPVDFTYSGGPLRRKRLSDQVEEETLYSKTEKMIVKNAMLIPMALAIAEVWKKC